MMGLLISEPRADTVLVELIYSCAHQNQQKRNYYRITSNRAPGALFFCALCEGGGSIRGNAVLV